jgi:RNA polymerase sigma factor (TIGR02999 family)
MLKPPQARVLAGSCGFHDESAGDKRLSQSALGGYDVGRLAPDSASIPTQTRDATTLLTKWRDGDRAALELLFPLVYDDLRARAHRSLRREREGHTLTTTALVHETYLRLLDVSRVRVQDRSHFFALAATAMRRVLVDYARRHRAEKRGGRNGDLDALLTSDLAHPATVAAERASELLELDDALGRLAVLNERLSRTVEMRFFGGMTIAEIAQALDLTESTVKLDWQKARAWLFRELKEA